MAAAERFRDQDRDVGDGNIVERDIFYAALCKSGCEDVGCIFGVTVHGGIENCNSVVFGNISAPEVIFVQQVCKVFSPYGTVQRADPADGKGRELFERCLYLYSVFADDIAVVTSGIIEPVAVEVYFICKQMAV